MKCHFFHLMPYADLPDDFREKYRSVWVDVPSHLYDPARGHEMYNEYLDELEYAAAVGFDGICVNEHHQNAYGMMPSPNIMAAALTRRAPNAAIIVLGDSIALYSPATRVAEEFAMLDVISGGRLIAGFPVGTSMDTNYGYGQTPATLREKYHEAHDLIIKAWTEPDVFAWNGKYNQLRYVNLWPRPIQKPHPPVWVPGGGSIETWEWVTQQDYLFAYLSYGGYKRAKTIMDGFWQHCADTGVDDNPYRAGFLQFVAVSEDLDQAQEDYGAASEYFYERCMHVYRGFAEAPGYRSLRSIQAGLSGVITQGSGGRSMFEPGRGWKDYVADGNIIAGSPESVTEQIRELAKDLRIGHLMCLLHFGNMPKDKVTKNTRLFAEKVLPNLRDLWSDYEDRWWIKPLERAVAPQPALVGK